MNQATPFPIEELAKAVAGQIAARGGPQPTIAVRQPAPTTPAGVTATGAATAAAITGEIIIDIKYAATVYGLVVKAPAPDFNAWLFKLTTQTSPEDAPVEIALFEFVDGANWEVVVNVPPISITDTLSIERVSVSLLDGTVPAYPPPNR